MKDLIKDLKEPESGIELASEDDARECFDQFDVPLSDRNSISIVDWEYISEDYSGSAFVIFIEDEEVYTVSGSHCSCYGLEDQWDPVKAASLGAALEEMSKFRARGY